MRLHSLTSLRFFAAFAVFLHHQQYLTFTSGPTAPDLYHYFRDGDAGVTFFYILSGFIISYAYNDRIELPGGRGDFLFGRFSRLYPTHFITFIAALFVYTVTPWQVLLNLTLTQSYSTDMFSVFSANGVSWSISDEMFFYAMFAVLAGIKSRHLIPITMLLAAMALYAALFGNLKEQIIYSLVYSNPLFRLSEFLIGMLLYRAYRGRGKIGIGAATLMEIGSIAVLAGFYLYSTFVGVPESLRINLYYVLPMSLVVLVFSFNAGALSRALSWRPLVYLGEISFAFYMVHHIVIDVIVRNTAITYTDLNIGLSHGAAMLGIALIAAAIVHEFEKRADSGLKALWKSWKARRVAA